MSTALLALGALLLIGGVGALSLPAAAILAGCLCLTLGVGILRSDGPSA